MSVRHGVAYGQFEVEHPTTLDPHTVSVCIEYTECDATWDEPSTFDWDYSIESVENEQGSVVEYKSWLTYELIKDELDNIVSNIE